MSVTAVPIPPVKTASKAWLWLGIIVAAAAAFGLAWTGTREQVALKGTTDQYLAWHKGQPGVKTTASGLQYQVLKEGEGPTAADGDGVSLTIEGVKRNGETFQPKTSEFRFQIGMQPLIPGFTEAVKLMKKGEHIRAWLPPKIGYGSQPGAPPELAEEVLIFDITIDQLVSAETIRAMQAQQQMMQGPPPGEPAPKGEAPAPKQ
jgi:FKBP-type peptidyl-prolyl cis-trans isomerase